MISSSLKIFMAIATRCAGANKYAGITLACDPGAVDLDCFKRYLG